MKVFITGGTGSIGGAVVEVLKKRNHEVFALGRTIDACKLLEQARASPIEGDLKSPASWIDVCDSIDGVIHIAAEWGDEMGRIDRQLVDSVLRRFESNRLKKPFIYTGGCWLYGETGDTVAIEDSPLPFDPLDSFAWSLESINAVLTADHVQGMVVHPAMVYERSGGVFERFFEDAKKLGCVRVVRGEHVRWPLIHRMDLAMIYVLLLERGKQGDVYNAATNHGVSVGEIARTLANRLGVNPNPIVLDLKTAVAEMGNLAEGYALDQQMSGDKARLRLGWRPEFEDALLEIA